MIGAAASLGDTQAQLLPIRPETISGQIVQTTSARDLHAFLEVGRDFSTWIKGRIDAYEFAEGVDYVSGEGLSSPNPGISSGHGGARPQRVIDYHLTIDMAKELAMVESNDKGREARRYFIRCERAAKAGVALPVGPNATASAFQAYYGVARLIGLDANQSALSAGRAARVATGENPLDTMGVTHLLAPRQEAILTPTDIGARMGGLKAAKVNELLQSRGFQVKQPRGKDSWAWEPTEAGKPYATFLDAGKKHSDGTPVRQLKWSAGLVDLLAADRAGTPA